MTKQTECKHEKFEAAVDVARLSHEENGAITGYGADIKIRCAQCGIPFRFMGVRHGYSRFDPRINVDGTELRAPLEPAYVPEILGESAIKGTA